MSRFHVKRSLRQLYIEKHALEQFIEHKKASQEKLSEKQVADLQSEEALLHEIVKDIEQAKIIAKII